MPRTRRIKAEGSIYHIMMRGNERKDIFTCDEDRVRILDTLGNTREKFKFNLYAYCLMDNHIHLLLYDGGNDISSIIKSINTSYAYYFNKLYSRCGHLFQDRFRSEVVDNDAYLIEASRYIHNNPVKANIVSRPEEYRWSSYNYYINRSKKSIIDKDRVLDIFSNRGETAINSYIDYVNSSRISKYNFIDDTVRVDIDIIMKKVLNKNGMEFTEVLKNRVIRDKIIGEIYKQSKFSCTELGRLFNLDRSTVGKIIRKSEENSTGILFG